MRKDRNLLEDLMKQLNCVYLSDLRTADFQNQAVCAALKFLPEDYPAAQWRDAANYLLDRAECLNTCLLYTSGGAHFASGPLENRAAGAA